MSQIQTLLEAEKKAAEIVNTSRRYRDAKKLDAENDARAEVEAYRKMVEQQFQNCSKEDSGACESFCAKVDMELDVKLQQLTKTFTDSKNLVLDSIVDAVICVEPKLHLNAK